MRFIEHTSPVSAAAVQQAIAHALADAPNESIGYVTGERYVPMANVSKTPCDEFMTTPGELLRAYEDNVSAFIHSHPSGKDCPTAADMVGQQASAVPWGVIVLSKRDEAFGYKQTFWFGDQLPILPYADRLFRHGVSDCYAIVRDWWRKERNVLLHNPPREYEWWKNGKTVVKDNMEAVGFQPIGSSQLREGDAVLMCIGSRRKSEASLGAINHLGIYIGNGLMIHHLASIPSDVVPITPWLVNHVVGYGRYRG